MVEYVWLIPIMSLVVLCITGFKLLQSARRYSRQDRNLRQKLKAFKEQRQATAVHEYEPAEAADLTLEQALEQRKALQKRQAKAKAERQRRLVKRLNSLSKPKEDN